jgi:hypothetical protein|tara:strand:- start:7500 stop:9635 length:2136 start_codon:yes stop_codon:yes gene_type:complete
MKGFRLSITIDNELQFRSKYTTLYGDSTDSSPNTDLCVNANYNTIQQLVDERTLLSVGVNSGDNIGVIHSKVLTAQNKGQIELPQPFCICNSHSCHYEDKILTIDAPTGKGVSFGNDGESFWIIDGGSVNFKQTFKGQEIAILFSGSTGQTGSNFAGFSTPCFSRGCDATVKTILEPITLESGKWNVINKGDIVNQISGQNPDDSLTLTGQSKGSLVIDYVGYNAEFECELSKNERWIETAWQGSVSISDVISNDGFIPTKYCKTTRPFILRDINLGETDITPDPIPEFNRGCVIPNTGGDCKTPKLLPPDQFIIIRYATYQVPGLENPTTGTQAYLCDQRSSSGKCLKWSISEVIEPVTGVVQCKEDSDCPLPLTIFRDDTCLNYFEGCIQNKCIYDNSILEATQCQNQVVTIVKQVRDVEKRTLVEIEGQNRFSFSQNTDRQSFNIGNKKFTATPASFSCNLPDDTDFLSPPNPKSSCWSTIINYNGKTYNVKDTESIFIENDLIKVQYFASGKLTRGKYSDPEDWANTFIFTIDVAGIINLNVLDLKDEGSFYVLHNSEKKIELEIDNKLPDGDVIIKVEQKVDITDENLPEIRLEQVLKNGKNKIIIDMDTANRGLNKLPIQLFYKIQADSEVLIPSDRNILIYNVVDEIPSVTKIVEVEKEADLSQNIVKITGKEERNLILIYSIIIISLLAIIAVILIIRYQKNK